MLLAPGNKKSLAEIGKIYGSEFRKIDLKEYRGRMKDLLRENPILFEEYAMRDSEITLKHINSMESFNYSLNQIGVPITMTSMSKGYVTKT